MVPLDSRARSIKTRIETSDPAHAEIEVIIREQDPLKQGLKHIILSPTFGIGVIREQDPLKQGLKLINYVS